MYEYIRLTAEMPAHGGGRKMAGLLVLVIMLIALYAHTVYSDRQHEQERIMFCDAIDAAKDIDRERIDRAIHLYKQRKELSKRKLPKMSAAIALGIVRGAIIGVILGGEAGIAEGMVSFASLNGILYWMGEWLAARVS